MILRFKVLKTKLLGPTCFEHILKPPCDGPTNQCMGLNLFECSRVTESGSNLDLKMLADWLIPDGQHDRLEAGLFCSMQEQCGAAEHFSSTNLTWHWQPGSGQKAQGHSSCMRRLVGRRFVRGNLPLKVRSATCFSIARLTRRPCYFHFNFVWFLSVSTLNGTVGTFSAVRTRVPTQQRPRRSLTRHGKHDG
ncbi:hypothetical protein ASPSYDRAFT_772679 [Aspergillus sydowii CBS 593.65]|uniref:Uncharacterized protein n=1 Tax=Aspergillus sydowii CBS 593.65 TaxID=1036612 RepID=A0A1L9TN48_9EURO|nr:uncharacterized protein ASPSYDRAFT_772679 [Aspergillus sydowii CBS 593.65]OJJ60847.1 hypothetical protein ASPSYDRAFT_772679 [Aspergillus sydowii CBS 593.65]